MREIALDTETTGLDPNDGHRIVEIGCVELVNHVPTGKTYHQYVNPERDMPAEAFSVHGLSEEFLSGHLGQNGTQFDALCHMGTMLGRPGDLNELRYYNGFSHADIASGRGFSKLGVEQVIPIFTRGVLIDIAAHRGRMLDRSEEFSLDDIRAALKRQGMSPDDIREGDALFYHTGWGSLWGVDNARFNSGTPGMSDSAGNWAVEKKVILVGSDNWAVEAIPGPDPDNFAPNHQKFLVENGIYIMENLDFSALIEAGVYEFAFVFGAMPIRGATGSPGRPFAIR